MVEQKTFQDSRKCLEGLRSFLLNCLFNLPYYFGMQGLTGVKRHNNASHFLLVDSMATFRTRKDESILQ